MNQIVSATLIALAAPAALATVNYGAHSATGWRSFYAVHDSAEAFERSAQFCEFGVCYDTAVRAGPDGLAVRQVTDYVAPGVSVFALVGTSVTALGTMTLQADVPGAPAWVDGLMTLRLPGGTGVSVDRPSSEAEILARLRLTVAIDDRRFEFVESDGAYAGWPPAYSDRMWRSGADTVSAWVSLPVGSFSFALILSADAVAKSYGSVGFYGATAYELGFFADRPVFELPAGYHVSSADFGIVDNQWCPGGCLPAPVPEPAPWLLAALGGLVLGWRRRAAAALALALLPAAAMAIEGDWKGTLTGADGTRHENTFRFDGAGRWVFMMGTRDGPRAWAIQRVGQTERWLLPGGGYGVLTVDELVVDRQRVAAVLRFRLESTLADGYLEQEKSAMAVDFQQHGDRVQAVVRHEGTITRTSSITGVREERIGGMLSGTLQR